MGILNVTLVLFVLSVGWLLTDTSAASCKLSGNDTSCSKCVGTDIECFYCDSTKTCEKRTGIVVSSSQCSGKWYTYSQCTIPGVVLIVIAPLAALIVLIFLLCCIYCICCRDCCRERNRKKWAKEDQRKENRKKDREDRASARDEERKLKHDQIRAKYGLFKDDSSKYQRFDAS